MVLSATVSGIWDTVCRMSETTLESKSDIISGPLPRVVFYLALPILLENFLAFLVGFYDVLLAGRLSEHATKAKEESHDLQYRSAPT